MIKIINHKKYNTETATEICTHYHNYPGDFSYYREVLMKKKTGEYFLYGIGGPMSKYAVNCGNNCVSGGEKIIPLSEEKALEFAEKYMDAEEYEELFGEVEE